MTDTSTSTGTTVSWSSPQVLTHFEVSRYDVNITWSYKIFGTAVLGTDFTFDKSSSAQSTSGSFSFPGPAYDINLNLTHFRPVTLGIAYHREGLTRLSDGTIASISQDVPGYFLDIPQAAINVSVKSISTGNGIGGTDSIIINEGGDSASIRLSLSAISSTDTKIHVDLQPSGWESDVKLLKSDITIPAGKTFIDVPIIKALHDDILEPIEIGNLIISSSDPNVSVSSGGVTPVFVRDELLSNTDFDDFKKGGETAKKLTQYWSDASSAFGALHEIDPISASGKYLKVLNGAASLLSVSIDGTHAIISLNSKLSYAEQLYQKNPGAAADAAYSAYKEANVEFNNTLIQAAVVGATAAFTAGLVAGLTGVAVASALPVLTTVAIGWAGSIAYDKYIASTVKQVMSSDFEHQNPRSVFVEGYIDAHKVPVVSHVIDGYISGATVYADNNGNGHLDSGELSTITDATGGFTLSGGTGLLIATGGTDTSTGLPLAVVLKAPVGAAVISPLTTLVADVGSTNAVKVLTALGLPAGVDVMVLDPVATAKAGDPSVYLATVKVHAAASMIGAVGGGTPADGFFAIETLLSNATSPVNLADPATITTLLASRPSLDAVTVTKLAAAIAGTISAIDAAAQGRSGDALITAASAVERVAVGVETQALAAAGTNLITLATVADSYTGQHLADAITLAATQLPGSTPGSGGTGSGGSGSGGAGSGGSGGGGSGSTGGLPTADAGSGGSGDPGTGSSHLPSLSTLVHDATSPAGEAYALYHGLLGRAPDTAGLQALTNALTNGASLHDVTQGLLTSPEGQSHFGGLDNAGFVAQLYQGVLGRAPDSAGLSAATAALDHGLSRADLADSFVFSPEHLGQLQPALTTGIAVPDPHAVSVAQAYYSLLGRAPDASGLQAFSNASLHDVAEGLMHSSEYASLTGTTSDTAYVESLYQHLLGRAADNAGAQTWTAALASGHDRADVANALLDSAEFQSHYAGQSSAAYVEALYEHVLGRSGDAAGVQAWTTALAHGVSRTDVAHAFTASSEFQAQAGGQSDAAFVEGLYTHALGRSADAAGEQAWLSALSHGASRADVVAGLMQSPEGQAHLTAQISHDWHLT